jgi:hypothetical protein
MASAQKSIYNESHPIVVPQCFFGMRKQKQMMAGFDMFSFRSYGVQSEASLHK